MNNYILIVDPLVSAKYTVGVFLNFGFKVLAFWTKEIDIPYFKNCIQDDLFSKSVLSRQDFNQDIQLIDGQLNKEGKIIFVMCGTDNSVGYADMLAEHYCPELANNSATFLLRFNKFEMIEALKKANLPTQYQRSVADLKDFKGDDFYYPVIVKPLAYSSGSFDVKKCLDKEEAEKQITQILSHDSLYGYKTAALIQNYVGGDEYAVNTVSYKGKHYITSVVKCIKKDIQGMFIYKYLEIVSDAIVLNVIHQYVIQVLGVLEVKNGFAHTEIKIQNGIPYLIELNPRVAGCSGVLNHMEHMFYDIDQQLLLCHFLDNKNSVTKKNYDYCLLYFLNNFDMPYDQIKIDLITSLDSYAYHKTMKISDNNMHKENQFSLNDVAAYIVLAHKDRKVIESDINMLEECIKDNEVFL